jgi:hypothetical protein
MPKPGRYRTYRQRTSTRVSRTKHRIFLVTQKTKTQKGKERIIKSSVGELRLRRQQLEKLGVEPRSRISPLLQKCCWCLSANESFAQAESDLYLLTGVKVGHSTLHRQVKSKTEYLDFPEILKN